MKQAGDVERVPAVVGELAAGPTVFLAGDFEAALVDLLRLIREQHHSSRSFWVQELGEQFEPRWPEVLCLVDDDRVEAIGDLVPVVVEVSELNRVPPLAIGGVGDVERWHALEVERQLAERTDAEVVAVTQPLPE